MLGLQSAFLWEPCLWQLADAGVPCCLAWDACRRKCKARFVKNYAGNGSAYTPATVARRSLFTGRPDVLPSPVDAGVGWGLSSKFWKSELDGES